MVDDEDAPPTPNDQDENQKAAGEWCEIPLNSMTESDSSTSSFSQHSDQADASKEVVDDKESKDDEKKQSGGFSDWISKSSFRRQSLEDVFAQSNLFGKFGRSLERRNSESEVETSTSSASSAKKEFFLFGRNEGLTDSQIENLFLPPENL